ncbi:hypothetical protein [Yinghuangia soli]|uniref:Uncharacterized protein n=1 Tax=Yinghuangia soli TaxID=2908204 RepID=A0AA41Q7S5_9ACTN|nr:hypothetical protein [Yinghuangia soli]MCF2533179.1 hypothetical protein [Yinghuangia soli]
MDLTAHMAALDDLLAMPIPGDSPRRTHVLRLAAATPTDDPDAMRAHVAEILRTLARRIGHSRTIALAGFVEPSFRSAAAQLLDSSGCASIVELYGWVDGPTLWFGLGILTDVDGTVQLVAVFRPGAVPWPTLRGRDWSVAHCVEQLAALTGLPPGHSPPPVDWLAVEAGLRRRLPQDYKLLVDTFGPGSFDDILGLHVPGPWNDWYHQDLVATPVGPAPRLVHWASTEDERFFWAATGDDPDTWPIVVLEIGCDEEHHNVRTVEFVHHMLADRHHPYSIARYVESHSFHPE